jgi:hypothetical protein
MVPGLGVVTEPGVVPGLGVVTELGGTGRIGDAVLLGAEVEVSVTEEAAVELAGPVAPSVVPGRPATVCVQPAISAAAHIAAAAVQRRNPVTAEP